MLREKKRGATMGGCREKQAGFLLSGLGSILGGEMCDMPPIFIILTERITTKLTMFSSPLAGRRPAGSGGGLLSGIDTVGGCFRPYAKAFRASRSPGAPAASCSRLSASWVGGKESGRIWRKVGGNSTGSDFQISEGDKKRFVVRRISKKSLESQARA